VACFFENAVERRSAIVRETDEKMGAGLENQADRKK